jgi:hypothetical protein
MSNTAEITLNTSHIASLKKLGVLQLSGQDTQGFLQNLVTNDVNSLAINQGILAGLCNPKGRLLGIFTIVRREQGFNILIPKSMTASIQQRLSMYILRSDVKIKDVSDSLVCVGLRLVDEASVSLPFPIPDIDYQGAEFDDGFIIKLPAHLAQHILFIGSTESINSLTGSTSLPTTDACIWEYDEIQAGLPMIYPDTREAFTTQQVNLDLVNGVSFKKGCYPGQEIVARLHYLGTPSRRMFVAEINAVDEIIPGREVLTSEGDVAGHVVKSISLENGKTSLLISLKLASLNERLVLNDTSIDINKESISMTE